MPVLLMPVLPTRSMVSLPLAVTSSSGVLEKIVSFVKVQCTNISQAFECLSTCETQSHDSIL